MLIQFDQIPETVIPHMRGGEGQVVNTPWSRRPNGRLCTRKPPPVGAYRERPLPRSRASARHEASAREGGVNRGGTANASPSVPAGTGGVFSSPARRGGQAP